MKRGLPLSQHHLRSSRDKRQLSQQHQAEPSFSAVLYIWIQLSHHYITRIDRPSPQQYQVKEIVFTVVPRGLGFQSTTRPAGFLSTAVSGGQTRLIFRRRPSLPERWSREWGRWREGNSSTDRRSGVRGMRRTWRHSSSLVPTPVLSSTRGSLSSLTHFHSHLHQFGLHLSPPPNIHYDQPSMYSCFQMFRYV